ncbi:mannose-6-phosphate isomerase, class I [Lutimonas saemankumensis]|uniref:mannose-6-phosphate isomerase, class I n=1 Tax=Lutimonas saemankumensis TaxID=483016 RepID=UPI001CD7FECF|nr:mannose-6-phosphate isomerase, class I [Lutimonas saemankumensis]MCA0933068.1 mannose-6-phosphate isomerase, class I [Lutimonas saemankumensis]
MKRVFPLRGQIQHYAWGGFSFIPEFLGMNPDEKPFAEYWMGAHKTAPSIVSTEEEEMKLDTFIQTDPEKVLGSKISSEFGRLPYLFKILDVKEMLSIQVHPSKSEARKGFLKENETGIPLTAPNRNYKDDNHKPEIMVALGEFWLLHGFKSKEALLSQLKKVPELAFLAPLFVKEGYKGLYQFVMKLSEKDADIILRPLIDRIIPLFRENKLLKSSPDFWAAKSCVKRGSEAQLDKGIFSIYFFNLLKVQKGEAVFQDAGIPHAYLEGQTLELMANSDNVLRGGLTEKHVDVEELLKHVEYVETKPKIIKGELSDNQKETIYKCKAKDFQINQISLDTDESLDLSSTTVEIFLVMNGEVEVYEGGSVYIYHRGESFLTISGARFSLRSKKGTTLFKATTPQK